MSECLDPCLFCAERVEELMTPSPEVIHPEATIREAMKVMKTRRFRHLPVVDQDGGLVGLVSQRDILKLAWPTRDQAEFSRLNAGTPVSDIMARPVDTIQPTAHISTAARYILLKKRDCLPVVNDLGHLVGILTAVDFLREVIRHDVPQNEEARPQDPATRSEFTQSSG